VAFSPDGKYLASRAGGAWKPSGYRPSDDRRIILWDVESGRPARYLTADGDTISRLVFTPDGTRLISYCKPVTYFEQVRQGKVNPGEVLKLAIWDLHTGEVLQRLAGDIAISCTSDIQHLIYCGVEPVLRAVKLPAPSRAAASP